MTKRIYSLNLIAWDRWQWNQHNSLIIIRTGLRMALNYLCNEHKRTKTSNTKGEHYLATIRTLANTREHRQTHEQMFGEHTRTQLKLRSNTSKESTDLHHILSRQHEQMSWLLSVLSYACSEDSLGLFPRIIRKDWTNFFAQPSRWIAWVSSE